MSIDEDTEFVLRARRGDRAAQDELFRRHRRAAYMLALQLMGNPDDALDVVQDAFVRFLTHLNRFDIKRPVRPWLYQIVRNRAVDLHRRHKVRRHASLDQGDDEDKPRIDPVDPSVDIEGDASRAEMRRQLWRALGELTENQREILVLRDYQDLSYQEIAESLEIPLGTVMSRLHGARRRLHQVLTEGGYEIAAA